MAFRFALESLLELRNSLEQRDQLLLEQNQCLIELASQLVDELRRQRDGISTAIRAQLVAATPAVELHCGESARDQLQLQLGAAEARLASLRLQHARLLANYVTSRRNRKVLSELKDCLQAKHDLETRRHSQRATDDNFLIHRFSGR